MRKRQGIGRSSVSELHSVQRVSTGIIGLDELIEGGYPTRRVILVIGGPGAGKTIFATQFLVDGAISHEKVLYVSIEEKKDDLYREMTRFSWDLTKLEADGQFVFVDATETVERASPQPSVLPRFGRSSPPLLGVVDFQIQQVRPARIAIDPISSLALQFPDPLDRRDATVKLMNLLMSSGATCVLTSELRTRGMEHEVQLEEYLSHGVIILRPLKTGKTLARAIMIEKMRETKMDLQPRPYRIGDSGIEVFPKENLL